MLPCIYHKFFGISCPMCGFQRSLLSFFKGEVKESLFLFPPMFYMFFVLIISIITYCKHKTLNTKTMKVCFIILVVLLVFNCIYQNCLI